MKGSKMIKQYFLDNCISIRAWAKKHGLNERISYMVVNGELSGRYNTKGDTREVFVVLVKEGIIKELPSGLREAKVS